MRLVYLGTPELAVAPLAGLHRAGHDIALVVSAPDRRRGRGAATSPSPVKAAALELGLRVEHDADAVLSSDASLGVVVAFGKILRPHLLAHVPMVNLHFSLLPRWRGAAPVERAILAGDAETGVCVMAVEEGLDTGGVYARATTPVGTKRLTELWDELSVTGSQLLVDWLPTAFDGDRLIAPEPQVGEVTYAAKLTADDRRLDLTASADQQLAVIRLGNAWTMLGEGETAKRLKVLGRPTSMPTVRCGSPRCSPKANDRWPTRTGCAAHRSI
jgi:methionyl-tRNA formyltransferase